MPEPGTSGAVPAVTPDLLEEITRRIAERFHPERIILFGSHAWGSPQPDSDVDLRGCHQLPLRDIVGIDRPKETLEWETAHDGTEIELVSHDIGKYLRLLVKNNGYILEQIFSPIVVLGQDFLSELRPLAERCITRHH